MKKLFLILSVFCALSSAAQKYTTVRGRVSDDRLKEVQLFKVVDGAQESMASTHVGPDGTYGFTFVPGSSGFYTLGSPKVNFKIYVRGGEEVNIDLGKTKAVLNGRNSRENMTLYRWEDYAADIREMSLYFYLNVSTYETFFPAYEKFLAGIPDLEKRLKSGNREFDGLLHSLIGYEKDYYGIHFLQTPRLKHPKRSEWPECYDHILSPDKFADEEVLKFPDGVSMVFGYANFGYRFNAGEGEHDVIREALSHLHNDRLKGEYLLFNYFKTIRTYDRYLEAMKEFGHYMVTPSLKTRAELCGAKVYNVRSGNKAADFSYPDAEGRTVSLSDFKGKVVLIDVWATWCGPCKKEIPHLIRLEKEMEDTDLVVLGVCVNEAKDRQKWLDFIKEKGLGGVQLFASGWSKITKDYKITGIPRFMVIDRKGRVVTADAPRPSGPALKKLLQAELAK